MSLSNINVYNYVELSTSNVNINQYKELSRKLVLHVLYQAKRDNRQIAVNIENHIKRVLHTLWRKPGYIYTNKSHYTHFVIIEPDGKIRATQYLINILLRLNDSIVFAENGGIKKTEHPDYICSKSENELVTEVSLIEEITETINILRDAIDYDSITNLVNGPVFKDPSCIVTNTVKIQEFTKSLLKLTTMESRLEEKTKRVPYITNTHRLNLRMRDFKPWKLYANKPIYSDCMAPMSFYDETNRTDFDVRFIVPEDIGRIITEFVGHDFISNIRKSIIMDKYKNSIENTLYKFNKRDLMNFAYYAPYNYMEFCTRNQKWMNNWLIRPSSRKDLIIYMLMTNFDNKDSYYPFCRDVIILGKLIQNHRIQTLNSNRNKK